MNPQQRDHKPTKRQSTLDESSTVDVPTTKKQKTGTDTAEEVKEEEEPKAVNKTIAVDKARLDVEEKNVTIQKGLIYFFFRPRVDHEKIKTPVDAQRSYIVLRPLPQGAVLESKTKLEDQTAHLLELPKKICKDRRIVVSWYLSCLFFQYHRKGRNLWRLSRMVKQAPAI